MLLNIQGAYPHIKKLTELVLEFGERFNKKKRERNLLDFNDLEHLCDYVYMIDDGNILLEEEMDALLSCYGILKVDNKQMKEMDLSYILRKKKEVFGYTLLTNQKQFYLENYPDIVIENNNIDEFIYMMIKGVKV